MCPQAIDADLSRRRLRLVPPLADDEQAPSAQPAQTALIYLGVMSDTERALWQERCMRHCVRLGYEVSAIVTGGLYAWAQVQATVRAGEADVVVISRREHLPAGRTPRVEEAGAEQRTGEVAPLFRRRPQRTRLR